MPAQSTNSPIEFRHVINLSDVPKPGHNLKSPSLLPSASSLNNNYLSHTSKYEEIEIGEFNRKSNLSIETLGVWLAAMSAGICGKRVGFEEIFGSPSVAAPAKKLRCCGSPIRESVDFGFGFEDKVSILIRMFPSMDPEVVEAVLKGHDHKIDDAIKSLHSLCIGDNSASNESGVLNSLIQSNCTLAEASEQQVGYIQSDNCVPESKISRNGSWWVDMFVKEMMNSSNWDDRRNRTLKALESFERYVLEQSAASKEQEIACLREQQQCLLRDNHILKKAVSLQHQRNLENEEKLKEVQQLKHVIGQYQEQIRTLELNNYSLQVHLQRAQEASSIPGHFHPDVF